MAGNNILSILVDHNIGLPRFLARNSADACGNDSLILEGTNLLASDVIPSQCAYQGNFLSPQNPGCRHSNIAPCPSRYSGNILRNNLFTRHWQSIHKTVDIPVYGTTYYQFNHLAPPVYVIEIVQESGAHPQHRLRVSTQSCPKAERE